jgi:hypothetical protein
METADSRILPSSLAQHNGFALGWWLSLNFGVADPGFARVGSRTEFADHELLRKLIDQRYAD